MNAPNHRQDNNPDTQSAEDSLDEDQQKAFESIMAQIESGEDENDNDDVKESYDKDNFAAELEKVARQADADNDAQPEEKADENPDDELDEDQQKAFESIMAQIESGENENDNDDVKESYDEDNFAAELEKIARQADADNDAQPEEKADENPDDELDEDQQKAFESIMAQIESGENDLIEEAKEADEPTDLVEAVTDPAESQVVSSDRIKTEETDTASDDHDGIIKEAARPEPAAGGPESTSPANEEKPQLPDPETGAKTADGPVDVTSQAKPSSDGETASPHALKAADPLPQKKPAAGGKKKRIIITSMVVALILVAGGFYYFYHFLQPVAESIESTPPTETPQPADTIAPHEPLTQEPIAVTRDNTDLSRLKRTTTELNKLRRELIDKQTEIEDLRAYYRAGIESEIKGLIDMIGSEGGGPMSFSAAKTHPRIVLGLQAIQRRNTYIDKLVTPSEALQVHSEVLLYHSRKADILSLMVAKTSDIDVDGFITAAEAVMTDHRQALSELNIDDASATPSSLENIWKDVNRRLSAVPKNRANGDSVQQANNAVIWKKICEGDLTQKHRLTALSPEAARCLAAWKGKDLFLNNLTDLSPEAARSLSNWPGDWLGLNGLTELTPEVARHLARWKGKGLSLNGLDQLTPRVVAILSEWQGQQIELINVRHMAHWENPNTRLFLSDALKRKLNETRK